MRKATGLLIALVSASAMMIAPASAATPKPVDPSVGGGWTVPFEEDPSNSRYPIAAGPTEHCNQVDDAQLGPQLYCKPAAVNATVLSDGRVLFWNGLANLENVQHSVVLEGGLVSRNSQARILDLSGSAPVYTVPHPEDGGATNPDAGTVSPYPLPGNNGADNNPGASGDMFCSDQVHLADGRVLIAGGTAWYDTPQVPTTNYGVAELQGLRSARIFDPATNNFTQAQPMNYGRWYPGLIELGDGRVFVGGGVRKLIQTDGTNVRNTEIFDPTTGAWTDNGTGGSAAMPLFPRYHLLPNGSVYYGGVGQMWGPAGESADELLYALRQTYDPATNAWTPYGFGLMGARSGAFSVMLPLKAPYTHVDVLAGGGTLGSPPGSYLADNLSEISRFDAATGWQPTFKKGPLLVSNRWFSASVTLPNDAVAVFSGADKDEVIDPGSESPVHTAEWYTPWDGEFHPLSDGTRDRTYHNSAVLLADGSVLVGGHAPINADYSNTNNTRHDGTAGTPFGSANNFRDPSFEIFRPPYMYRGGRPVISSVQSGIAYGSSVRVATPDAASISSVRLIRLPAYTHEVDGNMRSVELPILSRDGSSVTVKAPPNGNVAPSAPYYLFINRGAGADTLPSTAAIVNVGQANAAPATIPHLNATGGMAQAPSQVTKGTGTNVAPKVVRQPTDLSGNQLLAERVMGAPAAVVSGVALLGLMVLAMGGHVRLRRRRS
ncbi:MAG: hypothetical protein QOE92_1978 [Chloroflexota bacterium]|nr:hypothetical protein [Chloroflexota bacterium]